MTAGTARPPRASDRNLHPWRIAGLLGVGLFALVLLGGLALHSTAHGPEELGMLYGAALPGCIAVGIWGKRARTRWTRAGYAARIALCLVTSTVVMEALALASQVGAATP